MSADNNYLDLSDEDFAKMSEPTEVIPDSEPEIEPTEDDQDDPIVEDASEEKDPEIEAEEPEEDDEEDSEEIEEDEPEEKEETSDEQNTDDKETSEEKDTVDYKAAYERMMGTFKASGRDFTPKSPEDLIRLAQMGVNYHEKMAGMKPARKALKVLENNNLLDEEKLSFLIDISKGNKDAITKLIKEHEIDPLEVDTKADSSYVPTNHTVSEAELNLDSVLEDIQSSPSYEKTIHAVTKEWDDSSRQVAATNPHIISVINEHMDSGVYDTVMKEVVYQRSLGDLKGVSDLDAYKTVGDRLEAEGAFNKDVKPAAEPEVKKADPVKELQRKTAKKKASPNRTVKTKKPKLNFNPLEMSDEEFAKFDKSTIGL